MTEPRPRLCAHEPCTADLDLLGLPRNALYCQDACRTAAWKERVGYADHRKRKASRNGSSRPGGVTHPHRRVVALVERLVGDRQDAEVLVREIATPRQRERLEGKRA